MTSKAKITHLTTEYLQHFPSETDRVALFTCYLFGQTDDGLYHRKNFAGHITTSVFIVNEQRKELLLLRHKSLNRWLQPGGHVERIDNSLLDSALRETEEETTIPEDQLRYVPVSASDEQIPFDIDSHYIPANTKKNEEGHYHHDFRYLFSYTGNGALAHDEEESEGLKWVPFHELEEDATFGHMVRKIDTFLAGSN